MHSRIRQEQSHDSGYFVGISLAHQQTGAIGQQFSKAVVQQYAYHRLMTELKQRNFNVVGEQVEEDGTVRIQVRTYQG